MRFWARQCPACGLRFPAQRGSSLGEQCPHCGADTEVVHTGYDTHEIERTAAPGIHLEALLDNVRSLSNVGSVFRTADGVGVAALHLCGFTPTPKHPKLNKTALGAEHSVPWSQESDAIKRATGLREAGMALWALEGGEGSIPLHHALPELDPDQPLCLVLGHEVSGVDPRLQACCHRTVHIPMHGTKGSLNVGVAFGVASYMIRYAAHTDPTRQP